MSRAMPYAAALAALASLARSPPVRAKRPSTRSRNRRVVPEITGGILGGAIGTALDERDRQRAFAAEVQALEHGEPGDAGRLARRGAEALRHRGSRRALPDSSGTHAATTPTASISTAGRRSRAAPPAAIRTEAGRRSGEPPPRRFLNGVLNARLLTLPLGKRGLEVRAWPTRCPSRRLRQYLRELKPEARALLAAELERAMLRGEEPPGASSILESCAATRAAKAAELPRVGNPQRLFFVPARAVPGRRHAPNRKHRGRIARACLDPIWDMDLPRPDAARRPRPIADQVNLLLGANEKNGAEQVARAFQDLAEQRMRECARSLKRDG